jgi:hypothetical protein
MVGFAKEAIDLTSEDWWKIEQHNECLERLLKLRKPEITVEGPLVESKTAWKCAVLQQALLYRICALASGCVDAWNAGNVVYSILDGRALLETIALAQFIRVELLRLREPMNVDAANAIDDLYNQHLFATKNEKAAL